jgi:hypothetical protein
LLEYSFSSNLCHYGTGGAVVDPFIKKGRLISLTCYNFKSITLAVPEIFTYLLAEDTWRKSSSFKTSLSIRKLQIILLVRKTHIFHPTDISN